MSAPFCLAWLAGTLLPLGALWLLHRLALRGERCFGYNRAVLLLAPVVAGLWPLLPRPALPAWLSSATSAAGDTGALLLPVAQVVSAAGPAELAWSGWTWLALLYLVGVGVGLGRLVWQVDRLQRLARRLPQEARPGYALAYTGGSVPTSSFGRVVFWDDTLALASAEAAAVLAHELAHVRQHHTRDRLWLEAWRAVLWPNPFAHLLLPALRLTHELLADREAAAAGAAGLAATPYPTLLARLAAQRLSEPAYSSLLQPFTFSFTLTRIAMLQNQIPVRRWKQWLVLPVLATLFFGTSQSAIAQTEPTGRAQITPMLSEAQLQARHEIIDRKVREAEHQDSLRTGGKVEPGMAKQFNIRDMNGKPEDIIVTITRVKKLEPAPQTFTSTGHTVYTYVEQMPQLPGGGSQRAIVEAIQSKIVYPTAASAIPADADGRVFVRFTVDADGTVRDATIIKGLTSAFDEAVLAVVRQLPRFTPGKQDGKEVAVSITVPIKFAP